MLKRHEVEILLKAGPGKAEVARLTGVSLCSVKRIAQEGPVVLVDDAVERAQRQVGRPSTVAKFRKPILEILRRVRGAGNEGGKTALYALVAWLRPSRPSRWFVSKASWGSSVRTILEKSKWSSSRAPAGASIFSPLV